jgi:hypothetical protein
MFFRLIFLILAVQFSSSCSNNLEVQRQLSEDIKRGESLYWIVAETIKAKDDDAQISFSVSLAVWRDEFAKKYGKRKLQEFHSQMITKYGNDEKMNSYFPN